MISSLNWHHDLIRTNCMSSEACVLWSVGPMARWVCRAEAFNCKWHHLILTICKDNARSKLCTTYLFIDSHTNTFGLNVPVATAHVCSSLQAVLL